MNGRTALVESEDAPVGVEGEPLEIVVTNAGSITTRLYALLRKAVPILEEPGSVPAFCREALANRIRRELEGEEAGGWLDAEK